MGGLGWRGREEGEQGIVHREHTIKIIQDAKGEVLKKERANRDLR